MPWGYVLNSLGRIHTLSFTIKKRKKKNEKGLFAFEFLVCNYDDGDSYDAYNGD